MTTVRIACALVLSSLLTLVPSGPLGAQAGRTAVLIDVSHTLDGRTIAISGLLRNTGALPLRGLVIDATGYGAVGEQVALGTDGIPWQVAPGGTERFTMSLPLGPLLVREYVVQVTVPSASRPLATARRAIETELYRRHIQSLVTLQGSTYNGLLVVRADTDGLPVSLVSVRASLWALDPFLDHFRLVTLDFDVQAGRGTTVLVSPVQAVLVSLQVTDVRLRATWSE